MPTTRSQAVRETVATSLAPSEDVHPENASTDSVRLRKDGNKPAPLPKPTPRDSTPDDPPRFTIDLSLPPEQRYLEVCTAFKDEIQTLPPLFEEIVDGITRIISLKRLQWLCRIMLRRVYDEEENRELQGISRATGLEMYLLVCFNVLLDLFMGCSSGGVVVQDEKDEMATKMVHFRTLDWGMPSLRRVVVQLDFKTERDGPVVASSVTYAGYVGILTGVRKDLSLSLNFRPNRNRKGEFWADLMYYWHLLMVLLGWRRSISSQLRQYLLPSLSKKDRNWVSRLYSDIIDSVSNERRTLSTTACYLCFSNEYETTIVEKDRKSAVVRSSNDFIVITNNDLAAKTEDEKSTDNRGASLFLGELEEIVQEAQDRRQCAEHNFHNARVKKARKVSDQAHTGRRKQLKALLDVGDVVELVQKYPTTNEATHYACVLDAKEGSVRWCRRWMKPIGAKWIREHKSETW